MSRNGLQRIGRFEAGRRCSALAAVSRCVVLWSAALTLPALPAAADEGPAAAAAPHHIPRLEAQIDLDGKLEERAWSEAWTWELSFEVQPAENTPAPVRTEVLVFHDLTHLYIGFRAYTSANL